ncbi:hypothetical protein D3C81_1399830 [compost metagenome]
MRQAVREGRIEHHGEPVHRQHATVDYLEALGRLHPAVGGEDPEGGDDGADGHHHRREEVQARSHAVPAEQHDAEEAGLEEEGGEHLVGQQRPGDRAGKVGEGAPVGAELVGHDQAGHHAHAKVDGEDLRPEVVEVAVDLLIRSQPQAFKHGQVTGKADGDGGEQDMEGNGEGELDSSQV